jgi:hypothetical protein
MLHLRGSNRTPAVPSGTGGSSEVRGNALELLLLTA